MSYHLHFRSREKSPASQDISSSTCSQWHLFVTGSGKRGSGLVKSVWYSSLSWHEKTFSSFATRSASSIGPSYRTHSDSLLVALVSLTWTVLLSVAFGTSLIPYWRRSSANGSSLSNFSTDSSFCSSFAVAKAAFEEVKPSRQNFEVVIPLRQKSLNHRPRHHWARNHLHFAIRRISFHWCMYTMRDTYV